MKHWSYLTGFFVIAACVHAADPPSAKNDTTAQEKGTDTSGFGAGRTEISLKDFPGEIADTSYVILKKERFNTGTPTDLSEQEIKEVNELFLLCFKEHSNGLLSLEEYKIQYIPHINGKGEKEVWVNCLCNDYSNKWRTGVLMVMDGGNCYFHFHINLTTKKYYNFSINGMG